jgi:WhiB family transcriptional regulator, redox-sensing transcriptional regulator
MLDITRQYVQDEKMTLRPREGIPAWMEKGLCNQVDPELFFPESDREATVSKIAKRICRHCDVWRECRAYALEYDERFGIWGGMTKRERTLYKRKVLQS